MPVTIACCPAASLAKFHNLSLPACSLSLSPRLPPRPPSHPPTPPPCAALNVTGGGELEVRVKYLGFTVFTTKGALCGNQEGDVVVLGGGGSGRGSGVVENVTVAAAAGCPLVEGAPATLKLRQNLPRATPPVRGGKQGWGVGGTRGDAPTLAVGLAHLPSQPVSRPPPLM